MASLLQERTRLRTARSLNSILSAMQVVTVVRLQKTKHRVAQVEAYLAPLKKMLRGKIEIDQSVRRRQQLIVLSSNRGLCGSFNSSLMARVEEFSREHPGLEFIAFGRRGFDYLRRRKLPVRLADEIAVDKVGFKLAEEQLAQTLDPTAEIYLAYNEATSVVSVKPRLVRFYPLPEELAGAARTDETILEPEPAPLSRKIFEHFLAARFFQALLQSQLGELSARLLVLNSAVENSRDLITDLTLTINKIRQLIITRDLSEIVASAEALKGAEDE